MNWIFRITRQTNISIWIIYCVVAENDATKQTYHFVMVKWWCWCWSHAICIQHSLFFIFLYSLEYKGICFFRCNEEDDDDDTALYIFVYNFTFMYKNKSVHNKYSPSKSAKIYNITNINYGFFMLNNTKIAFKMLYIYGDKFMLFFLLLNTLS